MAATTLQERQRLQSAANARLGTAFFLLVEGVFFVGIVAAALSIRSRFAAWPPPGALAPNTMLLLANTLVLFASGLAAWRAWRAIVGDDAGRAAGWLTVAVALGAAFLAGQLVELSRLAAGAATETMLRDLFGTLSWLHGLHVGAGLVLLAIVGLLARRGVYGRERHALFTGGVLFWVLVVLTWPVLLAVLIVPS